MKIEYNKLLQMWQTKILFVWVRGYTPHEVIADGIRVLNGIRTDSGLSKILIS